MQVLEAGSKKQSGNTRPHGSRPKLSARQALTNQSFEELHPDMSGGSSKSWSRTRDSTNTTMAAR